MPVDEVKLALKQYDLQIKLSGSMGPVGPPGPEGPQGEPGRDGGVVLTGDNKFTGLLIPVTDDGSISMSANSGYQSSLGGFPGTYLHAAVRLDRQMKQNYMEAVLAVTAKASGYFPNPQFEKIGISSQVRNETVSGHWGAGTTARESAAIPYLAQGIMGTPCANITGKIVSGTNQDGNPGGLAAPKGTTGIVASGPDGTNFKNFFPPDGPNVPGMAIIAANVKLTRGSPAITDTYSGLMIKYTGKSDHTLTGITWKDPRAGTYGIPDQDTQGLPIDLKVGEPIYAVGYVEAGLMETLISPLSDGTNVNVEIGMRNSGTIGIMDSPSEKVALLLTAHNQKDETAAQIVSIRAGIGNVMRITARIPNRLQHGYTDGDAIHLDGLPSSPDYTIYNYVSGSPAGSSHAGHSIRLVSADQFDVVGTVFRGNWDRAETIIQSHDTILDRDINHTDPNAEWIPENGQNVAFQLDVASTSNFPNSGSIFIGASEITYTGKTSSPARFTGCKCQNASLVGKWYNNNTPVVQSGQTSRMFKPGTYAMALSDDSKTFQNGVLLRGVIDTCLKIANPWRTLTTATDERTIGIEFPNHAGWGSEGGPMGYPIILPNGGSLRSYLYNGKDSVPILRVGNDNSLYIGGPAATTYIMAKDGAGVVIQQPPDGQGIVLTTEGAVDLTGHKIVNHNPVPSASGDLVTFGYIKAVGKSLGQGGTQISKTSATGVGETVLVSIPIPAGFLGKNGRIRIVLNVSRNSNAFAAVTFKVKFGPKGSGINGQAVVGAGSLGLSGAFSAIGNVEMYNRGDEKKQSAGPFALFEVPSGYPRSGGGQYSTTVDTTVDTEINITAALGDSHDTCAIQGYQVIAYPSD